MKQHIKTLIFLLPLVVYSCSANLATDNESYYYYKNAINYIKNDSTAIQFITSQSNSHTTNFPLEITVSPKIFPPQLAEFAAVAIKNKLNFKLNDKEFNFDNSIADSLIKYEEYLFYEPYINNKMVTLSSNDNSEAIIFFSKVYNNFMTAILTYRDKTLTNIEIPKLRPSLNYLIIFKDKKIDTVITQMMSP